MQTVDNGHIRPKVSVETVLYSEFWNSNTAEVVNAYIHGRQDTFRRITSKRDRPLVELGFGFVWFEDETSDVCMKN